MEIDVWIDFLTDCLVHVKTGEKFNTEYRLVTEGITRKEAAQFKKNGWKFDWSIPCHKGYEVYELFLEGDSEVQGRIALKHICSEYYTHVDIVEVSPSNVGSQGKYKGVGAHLFAIACYLSSEAGNEGYVQFTAKTDLVEHYKKTLHAKGIDQSTLYIDSLGAKELINRYFKESE